MNRELIVREPELYFDSIHQELDNFLRDTFFSHAFGHPLNIVKNATLRPVVEVMQCKDNYKVKIQLPGVKKENIDVELDNDFMTITADIKEEKKEEQEEDEKNLRYHTSEFRYGRYQRTISFDQPIKADEASAKYKDGILCIKIPKQVPETKQPKKLEIKDE